jgi:hypothetical protein
MAIRLDEDDTGAPANAAFLALASDLAYLPQAEGQAAFREQLGLAAQLYTVDNTQAYVATSDDAVVLVFRGTENPATLDGLKDWLLTNALNLLVLPQGRLGTDFAAAGVGARFHQGFLDALAEIWQPVQTAVEAELARADRPLWITGHSLGGALAQLAAWLFLRRTVPVHAVYTFGAPMVGNRDAMAAFERELGGKIYRFVDVDDPIPLLPSFSLIANAYAHCPEEKRLGAAAGGAAALLHALAGKAVDGLLKGTLLDEVWTEVNRRVSCHMMPNYRDKIAGR